MITHQFLIKNGFTSKQASQIMARITKGNEVHNIKTQMSYTRNGKICTGFQFNNGVAKDDAIRSIRAYVQNMSSNSNTLFWLSVDKFFKEIK